MKHIVLLFALILAILNASAQTSMVDVEVYLPFEPEVAGKIRQNASIFFNKCNAAYAKSTIVDLSGINLSESTKTDIKHLWDSSPFKVNGDVYMKMVENKDLYEANVIFYIKNYVEYEDIDGVPKKKDNPQKHQEFTLSFNRNGEIVDINKTVSIDVVGSEIKKGEIFSKVVKYVNYLTKAHSNKQLDVLEQLYSDNAIIITGLNTKGIRSSILNGGERIYSFETTGTIYTKKDKSQYLKDLRLVFANNAFVSVTYSDLKIYSHPSSNPKYEGIYYAKMIQHYRSSNYSDDGYLTLVWDFRRVNNPNPVIILRAWFNGDEDIANIKLNM